MRRFIPHGLLVPLATIALLAACHRTSTGSGGAGGAMAKNALPAEVTPTNVAMGDSIFNKGSCNRCHGMAGIGAPNAPALNDMQWLQIPTGGYAEILGIITTGVPATAIKDPSHKNPMGPRGGRMMLTDPQIHAVAAYVYTLSHKG